MEGMTMSMHFSRGAAAALLGITIASAAGAQAAPARVRDTIVLRTFNGPFPAESLMVLVRRLDQEQIGSPNWVALSRRLDALMAETNAQNKRVMLRASMMPEGAAPKGWLGFYAQGIMRSLWDSTGQRVTYFAYPSIVSVEPESPAARAGIAPGDELVAYDGVDVVGHEFNMTKLLVPERKLAVTVRREGETKDYTLAVARLPERAGSRRAGEFPRPPMPPMAPATIFLRRPAPEGDMPAPVRVEAGRLRGPLLPGGIFIMSSNGVLGVHMSAVSADLAKALHLSTGVLVNDVPESSPAFASGLRTGDVIVSIGGRAVEDLDDVHAMFGAHMADRQVDFRVMRDRKARDITVRW